MDGAGKMTCYYRGACLLGRFDCVPASIGLAVEEFTDTLECCYLVCDVLCLCYLRALKRRTKQALECFLIVIAAGSVLEHMYFDPAFLLVFRAAGEQCLGRACR